MYRNGIGGGGGGPVGAGGATGCTGRTTCRGAGGGGGGGLGRNLNGFRSTGCSASRCALSRPSPTSTTGSTPAAAWSPLLRVLVLDGRGARPAGWSSPDS